MLNVCHTATAEPSSWEIVVRPTTHNHVTHVLSRTGFARTAVSATTVRTPPPQLPSANAPRTTSDPTVPDRTPVSRTHARTEELVPQPEDLTSSVLARSHTVERPAPDKPSTHALPDIAQARIPVQLARLNSESPSVTALRVNGTVPSVPALHHQNPTARPELLLTVS